MSHFRQELTRLVAPYSSGVGVEIGVHKGGTSQHLLRAYPKLQLWLVDAYAAHPDYPVETQQANFAEMMGRTQPFVDRRVVVRETSTDAAELPEIRDKFFDFIFIDADHRLEAVREDLRKWWPRVKPGGLFCGHDYGKREYGVTQAVDEWYEDTFNTAAKIAVVPGAHLWWCKKSES